MKSITKTRGGGRGQLETRNGKLETVFMKLETPNLTLRPVTLDDAADIFAYASDPEVTATVRFATHRSLDDTRAYISLLLERAAKGQPTHFGLEHKQDGKLIGTCGLVTIHAEHRSAEIGYVLHRAYWGKGLASEALAAVCAWAFAQKMFPA